MTQISDLIGEYDASLPLQRASTIPSSWYVDSRIEALEQQTVFHKTWQVVGRADQVREPGRYFTAVVATEPIVVVRGQDGVLRGFYNVCRHHAAAVMCEHEGKTTTLRCPYHGWTYGLDGTLRGTPEFDGVADFDTADHALVPIRVAEWEHFVLAVLDTDAQPLEAFIGDLAARVARRGLARLQYCQRRTYELKCNWKVFADNYLDGGYHVPHAHKSLSSVLDYKEYKIECSGNFCEQSSPLTSKGADEFTASVRRGEMAYYYYLYPNFMINWYEGVMDTNLVLPLGTDRCRVIFDFYFDDVSDAAKSYNTASVEVAERVQQEDIGVCESVQRGLRSRAYDTGRFSVRREEGEHWFHHLLYDDFQRGLAD